jgi:imipenem/basic amino acid-specific outer membrane pore
MLLEIQILGEFMKKTIISLAAVSALAVSSFAASDLAGAFKEGKTSGQVRAMYISTDNDGAAVDPSGFAIGGKLKFETASLYGISAGATFYTTNDLGMSDNTFAKVDGSLFDNGNGSKDSYSLLGEAYLVGQYGKTTVKIGRQQIDTPLAGSDDARMIPNLFEAALVINTDIPDTTLIGGYVARMTGWDSASTTQSYTKFISASDAALGNGTIAADEGVYVLAAVNNSIKDLTLQGWYYAAQEVLNAYYFQADYKIGALALAAQYYNIDDTGKTATLLKSINAPAEYTVYGAKASYSIESIGLTPYIAYNKVSDDTFTPVFGKWGGYSEFTNMEELWFSTAGNMKDASVYKIGADYSLEKLGLAGRTLSVAYGNYDLQAANSDVSVMDIIYTCNSGLVKNLDVKVAYEAVDKDAANSDQSIFKVIANYNF